MRATILIPVLSACLALHFQPARAAETAPAPAAAPAAAATADTAKVVKPKKKKVPKAKAAADSAQAAAKAAAPAPVDSAKAAAPAAAPAVDTTKQAVGAAAGRAADSAKASPVDTAHVAVPADTAKPAVAAADSAKPAADSSDTASARPKKRKRIVRETTVNSIDELKGRYRSPKRAMFMSLILPGLGQAYVGQHWSNYARGAFYFLTDAALIYGWHYYVVDRQDHEITRYKHFADEHWRQSRYETAIDTTRSNLNDVDKEKFAKRNPHRTSYCDAVQETQSNNGKSFYAGCKEPTTSSQYPAFKDFYNDDPLTVSVDSVARIRAAFVNPQTFYELVGKEEEFITGWDDAPDIVIGDTTYLMLDKDHKLVSPVTVNQQIYVGMRDKANEYARMQAYFLGGMVLNHIVSALDAALAAHFHNRSLYQTEVRWYDKVRLESHFAWQDGLPTPTVTAMLTF